MGAHLTEDAFDVAGPPPERRHGIYTFEDGSVWDSETNTAHRGPSGGNMAAAANLILPKPQARLEIDSEARKGIPITPSRPFLPSWADPEGHSPAVRLDGRPTIAPCGRARRYRRLVRRLAGQRSGLDAQAPALWRRATRARFH